MKVDWHSLRLPISAILFGVVVFGGIACGTAGFMFSANTVRSRLRERQHTVQSVPMQRIYVDGNTFATVQQAIQSCRSFAPVSCYVDARNPKLKTQTFTMDVFAGLDMPITLETGKYLIEMDMGVVDLNFPSHFHWTLHDTTLRNSNPASRFGAYGMLNTHVYSATGSIVAGTNLLQVSSPIHFSVGGLVAILGAKGGDPHQATVLNAMINSTSDALPVYSVNNLAGSASWGNRQNTLLVDSELIQCSGVVAAVFTGCNRGMFGTRAVPHANRATVEAVEFLIAKILAIKGREVTIGATATFTVTNAPVQTGVTDIVIDGKGLIDGNQITSNVDNGMVGLAILYGTNVRTGLGITWRNFEHGAILCIASQYNSIKAGPMENIGKRSSRLGSDIWLFQQCSYNRVRTSGGRSGNIHILIDDRTDQASVNDGPSSFNSVDAGPLVDYVNCLDLEGFSSENHVKIGECRTGFDPSIPAVWITGTEQWTTAATPKNNMVRFKSIEAGNSPAIRTGTFPAIGGNILIGGVVLRGSVSIAAGDVQRFETRTRER